MAYRNKLSISTGFIAFLCIYYYLDPMRSFVPFVISGGLHELGHMLMLRILGGRIHKLRLFATGAVLETSQLSYRQELLCAAAGPIVNITLMALTMRSHPMFALVNLCLAVYNLFPLYPLDGGRILHALLSLLLPSPWTQFLEKLIGILFLSSVMLFACYLTAVWHAGLWPPIVAGLLFMRVGEMIFPKKSL